MNDSKKSKLWVYAVVLFTSAFIVLLFTAYSQIKLNENLTNYKNQVINKETEKNEVQKNYLSAQEMNEDLNKEIESLKQENEELKNSISALENENDYIDDKMRSLNDANNKLLHAMNLYLSDDFVNSAAMLKEIEINYGGFFNSDNYISILKKVYYEAGKKLYNEGYASFKKRDYEGAVNKFIKSYEYAPDENFSDECLYYTAYSKLYLSDKNGALDYMNKLVSNYPESNLYKNAKRFISKYGK